MPGLMPELTGHYQMHTKCNNANIVIIGETFLVHSTHDVCSHGERVGGQEGRGGMRNQQIEKGDVQRENYKSVLLVPFPASSN